MGKGRGWVLTAEPGGRLDQLGHGEQESRFPNKSCQTRTSASLPAPATREGLRFTWRIPCPSKAEGQSQGVAFGWVSSKCDAYPSLRPCGPGDSPPNPMLFLGLPLPAVPPHISVWLTPPLLPVLAQKSLLQFYTQSHLPSSTPAWGHSLPSPTPVCSTLRSPIPAHPTPAFPTLCASLLLAPPLLPLPFQLHPCTPHPLPCSTWFPHSTFSSNKLSFIFYDVY